MTPAIIHIDGASRGNPGPAAFAVVIRPPDGPPIEVAEVIPNTTNNVAEYTALVAALHEAQARGLTHLHIQSDSELLVKQMNGEYRVKSPDLQELFLEASHLRKQFASVKISHVRREQNKRADELCNHALDGKLGQPTAAPNTPKLPKPPAASVSDDAVRADVLACLEAAAKSWADQGPRHPPAEQLWEQIWSILEEGGVLRKKK
ncbi:MAG: ribonuclease HI family protein [Fimbriiglobus sp.]|jgi:ribonuclease HI|nr:ribonuclease HI family protein [Fimbriiglobus sp.]